MSIYDQPNSYECGPYALKHALLLLGVFEGERRLARLAGTDPRGTDEVQLARAADRLGFDLPTERARDPEEARRRLLSRLDAGNPVLLCVDQWDHWVTVAGETGGRFVVLDSAVAGVVQLVDWNALSARWVFRDRGASGDRDERVFDLNPLISRCPVAARARLEPQVVERLATGDHRELGRDWSAHASHLLELAGALNGEVGHPETVPIAALLEDLRPRRGAIERPAVDRLRLVSATYGLMVGRRAARAVVRELTDIVRRLSR